MQPKQSWDHVASWYDGLVGEKGQYFHQRVIFPRLTTLLDMRPGMRVLDLACGQGAWARELAQMGMEVTGVDSSRELIALAHKYRHPNISYQIDDARTLRSVEGQQYDRITCILALQNIDPIDSVFSRIRTLLAQHGTCTIVLLHPSFRSPRITGWGEDTSKKLQYRRVDRYMTPMKIPIDMHPGSRQRQLTWTYHRPLQTYVQLGKQSGLVVTALEEWVSTKISEGKAARQENLARAEIPVFLAISFQSIF